jgi:tetratricopeptide (TPR) repeat protein
MEEITLGLKGDPQEDAKYLLEQQEKYASHAYGKEIIRATSRILFKIAPEELKKEWHGIIENHNLGIEKVIEEIDFQIYKKNYTKALEILEELIANIEEAGWYADDKVSEYHCFNNLLEEVLYREIFKPKKIVRSIPEDYAAVYFRYGNILFEFKKYNEAKSALEKACKYNPINTGILFELSEIYKTHKNWKKYWEITHKCMDYAYSSEALARGYRNFGFYYIEQNQYDLAAALYTLSLAFEADQKNAQAELFYISQKADINIQEITMDKIIPLIQKNGIRFGANNLVLSIAYAIGKRAQEAKENEMAKYFLGIVFELTNDKETEEILKTL